jgi:hypothetical protein
VPQFLDLPRLVLFAGAMALEMALDFGVGAVK